MRVAGDPNYCAHRHHRSPCGAKRASVSNGLWPIAVEEHLDINFDSRRSGLATTAVSTALIETSFYERESLPADSPSATVEAERSPAYCAHLQPAPLLQKSDRRRRGLIPLIGSCKVTGRCLLDPQSVVPILRRTSTHPSLWLIATTAVPRGTSRSSAPLLLGDDLTLSQVALT